MNNKKRFTPEEQRAKRLAFAKAYHERNKERIAYRQRYRELGEVFARFGYVLREPKEPEETYDEMKEVFQRYGYVVR